MVYGVLARGHAFQLDPAYLLFVTSSGDTMIPTRQRKRGRCEADMGTSLGWASSDDRGPPCSRSWSRSPSRADGVFTNGLIFMEGRDKGFFSFSCLGYGRRERLLQRWSLVNGWELIYLPLGSGSGKRNSIHPYLADYCFPGRLIGSLVGEYLWRVTARVASTARAEEPFLTAMGPLTVFYLYSPLPAGTPRMRITRIVSCGCELLCLFCCDVRPPSS
jgi:hypothetical protein